MHYSYGSLEIEEGRQLGGKIVSKETHIEAMSLTSDSLNHVGVSHNRDT